jgi:hypothetical protein
MVRTIAVALLLVGAAAVVEAAPAGSCFRPNEIEAEQAVRFQTELMVLSETCRRDTYVRFLQRNADVIASYQRQLVDRFARTDHGHGERGFDRYITALANRMSLDMGREAPAALCDRSADFLTKVGTFEKGDFRRYVADQATQRRSEYRHCAE